MRHLRWLSWTAIVVVVLGMAASSPEKTRAASPSEIADQKEKQRQIQAETDRLVRQIQTMVRVLEYSKIDKTSERDLLEEMGKTLAGLSRDQMTALLAALESASKSSDATKKTGE